jgi:hypothetical protein
MPYFWLQIKPSFLSLLCTNESKSKAERNTKYQPISLIYWPFPVLCLVTNISVRKICKTLKIEVMSPSLIFFYLLGIPGKGPICKVTVPFGHSYRIRKYKNLKHMTTDNGNSKTKLWNLQNTQVKKLPFKKFKFSFSNREILLYMFHEVFKQHHIYKWIWLHSIIFEEHLDLKIHKFWINFLGTFYT